MKIVMDLVLLLLSLLWTFTQLSYEEFWIIMVSKDWNANITMCTEYIGKFIRCNNNSLKAHGLIILDLTN
jgi:hypothetical protein